MPGVFCGDSDDEQEQVRPSFTSDQKTLLGQKNVDMHLQLFSAEDVRLSVWRLRSDFMKQSEKYFGNLSYIC